MSGAADVFSSSVASGAPAYGTLAKDACKTRPHALRLVPNCRACISTGLVGTQKHTIRRDKPPSAHPAGPEWSVFE